MLSSAFSRICGVSYFRMAVMNKPLFLIEDDQVDAMVVRRALKELHVANQLEHVEMRFCS